MNYSYADFDVRHQINVNGLLELPFGEGRKFGGGAGPVMNAIIDALAPLGIGDIAMPATAERVWRPIHGHI